MQKHERPFKALAHITSGGLLENLPRVLPDGLTALIHTDAWEMPEIFSWLQEQGNIDTTEMRRVLNCGIGMTAIVSADRAEEVVAELTRLGEEAQIIGQVRAGTHEQTGANVQFD